MTINETLDEAAKGQGRIMRRARAIRVTRKGWRFTGEQKLRLIAARFAVQSKKERLMGKTITVCSECLQACCWQGEFMCDEAKAAGTVERTKEELANLGRENPEYWDLCPNCSAPTVSCRCRCGKKERVSDDKQPTDLHAQIERFMEELEPHLKINSERIASDMLRATLSAFCRIAEVEVGYFLVSGDDDGGGRVLGKRSRKSLNQMLAPRYRIAEVDAADERHVFIVKYHDSTAGDGIGGVWLDESLAVKAAKESSQECCRFPGEEGWPKEVNTYGNEILHIEYGPESYTTVEKHEVKS